MANIEEIKLMSGVVIPLHTQSHGYGAAAKCTITVVDNPQIPEHGFFVPEKVFHGRIRHANATKKDDAGSNLRGCALKFADSSEEAPLDILMNTGAISPFWDLPSFILLSKAFRVAEHLEDLDVPPALWAGKLAGSRHAPDSYSHLIYYNQCPMQFLAKDGKERYCRYRVVPFDPAQVETGMMSFQAQMDVMVSGRNVTDIRPEDYLRHEFEQRVQTEEGAKYRLQIQLRDPDSSDKDFFNNATVWDSNIFPYVDLAVIAAKEVVPADSLKFNPARLPKGHLKWPKAFSQYDFRSIPHCRKQVYKSNQAARTVAGHRQ